MIQPTSDRNTPALLATATLLSLAVFASDSQADGPAFDTGIHLTHHRVSEHSASGTRLVTETGWIAELEAGLSQKLPVGMLRAQLSWSDGTLDYDGRTQTGASFQSQTDQRILRAGLHYAIPVTPSLAMLLGWEMEKRARKIQGSGSVAGLDEDYRQQMASFGVLWLPFASRDAFTARGEFLTGIGSRQGISSPGLIDPVTVPGNGMWGTRLSARVPVGQLAGRARIFATPRVEYLHNDRSDPRQFSTQGRLGGTVTQPETTRWQIGAGLELAW
jgi:hypothetical protein